MGFLLTDVAHASGLFNPHPLLSLIQVNALSLMGLRRVSSLNITNTASRSHSSFISSRTLQLELAGGREEASGGLLECLMTGQNPSVGLSGVAQITDNSALWSV